MKSSLIGTVSWIFWFWVCPSLSCAEKVVQVNVPLSGEAEDDAIRKASTGATNSSTAHQQYISTTSWDDSVFCDGLVHELDLDNFHSVLNASSFTLVLFYDPHALHQYKRYQNNVLQPISPNSQRTGRMYAILQRLAKHLGSLSGSTRTFYWRNLRVRLAAMDTRHHSTIRNMYLDTTPGGGSTGKAYDLFYAGHTAEDKLPQEGMITAQTFMHVPLADLPTFPAFWAVMHNFDIISLQGGNEEEDYDDEELEQAEDSINATDYKEVATWFLDAMRDNIHHVMNGPGEPHPLKLAGGTIKAEFPSFIHQEQETLQKYKMMRFFHMGSINWTAADAMAAQKGQLNAQFDIRTTPLYKIPRDPQTGEAEYYTYHETVLYGRKPDQNLVNLNSAQLLRALAHLTVAYLAFADAYENLWDDVRRAAEDVRTGYGARLKQLNADMRDALLSAYDDLPDYEENEYDDDDRDDDLNEEVTLVSWDSVPDLRAWFEDMLFGFGRSTASLGEYLEKHVFNAAKKGVSADDLMDLELFQRIREYMAVREECIEDSDRYLVFLRALVIRVSTLLADFHQDLTRHYLEYLEDHPEEKENRYDGFQQLDVFDMKDPKNFELLSDYDSFEKKYTKRRKPFILSNVGLTGPFNYTLEFLVDQCGFMDVTTEVSQSRTLGNQDVKAWGGLTDYALPYELMTEQRRKGKGEDDDVSINFEQFVELSKRFDDLYLHDFTLQTECTRLFWQDTPYDPPSQQYFHIPSVIGRYDMYQKLHFSTYAYSWPSLFVGRKGSNSKLHIDSGANAFWMYLIKGTKRWVVYEVAERPFLYESFHGSSYVSDVLSLNATQDPEGRKRIHDYFDARHPLLSRANSGKGAYEILQKPGDLVFIPPNTPHAVENLEDTIGVSFNMVPRAGIANSLFDLIYEQRSFSELEEALRYLITDPNSLDLAKSNHHDPLYITLGEYLAQ